MMRISGKRSDIAVFMLSFEIQGKQTTCKPLSVVQDSAAGFEQRKSSVKYWIGVLFELI